MTRKGDRIVARHIMTILDENKGVAMRFSEIYKTIIKHDWFHFQGPISNNLKYLLSEGKIIKTHFRYGIPATGEDGTRYIVVKNPGLKDEIVELGK